MKSNLFKIALVVAIAVVGGNNVFNAQKSESLSDVALANVEALAMDESSKYEYRLYPCPDSYGNQCGLSNSERPICSSVSYCP